MRLRVPSLIAATLAVLACGETPLSSGGDSLGDDLGESDATDLGHDGGMPAQGYETFFISESTKFDGGGSCENDDLNTVTKTLRSRLDDAQWVGLRFVDDNSWPEDFQESTLLANALDGIFGDAASLTVYAGHGGVGQLQWGRPSENGACRVTLRTQARLGRLAGDEAKIAMFLTSCTSRQDQVWSVYRRNSFRHAMGYHNSPYIGHDEARKVFKRMQDGQSSVHAWLDEMEQNGAPGKNSPLAMTLGSSEFEAEDTHALTNLALGKGFDQDVIEPAGGYYYEWYNNGCTVLCGNCASGLADLPDLIPGEEAAVLKLTRPWRDEAELLARASLLLQILGKDLSDAERDRLERWAVEISESKDLVYVEFEAPKVGLSYDPDSDLLQVSNLDALARARPRASEARHSSESEFGAVAAEKVFMGVRSSLTAQLLTGTSWSPIELSTREVGFGHDQSQSPSIPYEYRLSVHAKVGLFDVVGTELTVGVTRHGELSSVVVSEVVAHTVGATKIARTPGAALAELESMVRAREPRMDAFDFDDLRLGYALAEGEMAAVVSPSVLVGHVGAFLDDEGVASISRRVPIRISLSDPKAHPESLAATDVASDEGDERGPR